MRKRILSSDRDWDWGMGKERCPPPPSLRWWQYNLMGHPPRKIDKESEQNTGAYTIKLIVNAPVSSSDQFLINLSWWVAHKIILSSPGTRGTFPIPVPVAWQYWRNMLYILNRTAKMKRFIDTQTIAARNNADPDLMLAMLTQLQYLNRIIVIFLPYRDWNHFV